MLSHLIFSASHTSLPVSSKQSAPGLRVCPRRPVVLAGGKDRCQDGDGEGKGDSTPRRTTPALARRSARAAVDLDAWTGQLARQATQGSPGRDARESKVLRLEHQQKGEKRGKEIQATIDAPRADTDQLSDRQARGARSGEMETKKKRDGDTLLGRTVESAAGGQREMGKMGADVVAWIVISNPGIRGTG